PAAHRHRWLTWPLVFHNRVRGCVGTSNGTPWGAEPLRAALEPFLPGAVAALVGGHLQSLEVQASHDLFLSAVSHEIRTPLNGVVAGLDLVARLGPLTPEQQTHCRAATQCSRQLLELINDLLDFGKMRCGRLTLEVHPLVLGAVVDDVY